MKIVSILLSAFFAMPAFAQQITQPADSIPNLLCKKWVASYTEMGGMKISPQPGAPIPADQLTMLVDTKDVTPDDPTLITMVFKVK